jgi:hypothetical protein
MKTRPVVSVLSGLIGLLLTVSIVADGSTGSSSSATTTDSSSSDVSGLRMSQLNLRNDKGDGARVNFGTGDGAYSIGITKDGFFTIEQEDEAVLSVNDDGDVSLNADSVIVNGLQAGSLVLNSVPQWQLYRMDVFDTKPVPIGWSFEEIMQCSALSVMIGRGDGAIANTFVELPKHTQIRIQATVHFIDDWQGETAYLKSQGFYLWTESHDQRNSATKFSVCGSDLYPESRFTVPIDITLTHESDSFSLAFGDNVEDGSEAKFGVSTVSIWLRVPVASSDDDDDSN